MATDKLTAADYRFAIAALHTPGHVMTPLKKGNALICSCGFVSPAYHTASESAGLRIRLDHLRDAVEFERAP